ncbi:AraC family transcriptional regulator [Paenibacillus sp. SYP-B3998]|uniref:AraC family transcriptional regulator n=1 Tax=Paenibacillus sp. SYP-B3998 TaxID=2678564 RepID=A0A6G4A1H7_9BACL|nr:GyrI-like domain-containing protein [Paenibacillus sp. SYP-B3998]NEW07497.1 AraC family transcriptional regulator [Paenibacillus sp. SYP-B3998]
MSLIQPKIVQLDAFHIMGLSARTSNALESGGNGSIPKLWQQFYQEQISERITNPLPNSPTIGLYTDYENGVLGLYTSLIGLKVTQVTDIPESLTTAFVPAGKYAVFTTARGPFYETVPQCWAIIWDLFTHSDMERTYTGDFELYDERAMNPEDAEVDIYIAIK